MRAALIADDRRLVTGEIDEPSPSEGQVRVRVEACGICGSDLHMRPSEAIPAGIVMGHEFAGIVESTGPGVDGWSGGERVCVFPFRPLDHHDLEVAMATGLGLGAVQGGFAESVVVDQSMLWRLPDALPLEHGALVEPLSVALHGLNVGAVSEDDLCAVIGAGPIGVMTAIALRARGVERTVVIERNESRRRRIEELGFSAVEAESAVEDAAAALGGPPSVVLECAGHPAATALSVDLVAPSGIVVLLGVLEEPVTISQLTLMIKEAQIRASFAYRPRDFDESIELLAAGSVPAGSLITGEAPLDDAQRMFEALEDPATTHLKVLLRPGS